MHSDFDRKYNVIDKLLHDGTNPRSNFFYWALHTHIDTRERERERKKSTFTSPKLRELLKLKNKNYAKYNIEN